MSHVLIVDDDANTREALAVLADADDDRIERLDAWDCLAPVVHRCFLCRHDSSFTVE